MRKVLGLLLIGCLMLVGVAWGEESGTPSRTYVPYTVFTVPYTSAPSTEGAIGFNFSTHAPVFYNGTGWFTLLTTAGNAASSTLWGPYASITGPSQARTFTFPNASATIYTDHSYGTTSSSTGTISVTTALNLQTFLATGALTWALPTGDLSANVATGVAPLKYTFVKTAAGTVVIAPGTGNFIDDGAAGKTMTNSVAGETYATMTLQLISSATSVNTWVIVSGRGTWAMTQ